MALEDTPPKGDIYHKLMTLVYTYSFTYILYFNVGEYLLS
jgi:hypothetical protein